MKRFEITKNRYIGENEPCFIIAEAGINHNGSIKLAKKMINAAKECRVDAIKFQTFKSDEFISDPKKKFTYFSQGKKITESMFKMFKRMEFSSADWKEIIKYCKKRKLIFSSTPQNASDLNFLLKATDLPFIKIGSDDLNNLELIKYYASKNKPLIISTGMSFMPEVKAAIDAIKKTGNNKYIILHCVSEYPAKAENLNLRKIITLKNITKTIVGFSDHSQGQLAAVVAVSLGAKVIEKHFTINRSLPGPDHWFSSDLKEMRSLVNSIRITEKMLGYPCFKPTPGEVKMRDIARRSIVASRNLFLGEVLAEDSLDFKRPGNGLAPEFAGQLIGKKIKQEIKKDELITFPKLKVNK